MSIDIDPLSDAAGLTVTDHIENTQFEVYTDRPVEPAASPEDAHYFPVDASVTVETGAIEIPRVAVVETRCGDTLLTRGDSYAMPAGTYHVGIDPAPTTKLYLAFASPFSVSTTERTTRIDLDAPAEVTLGFRSLHQVPAGTIDPDRPRVADGRRVATRLRSQTTSPERSFPTLRGHPPLIEPGEEFRVPDRVEPEPVDRHSDRRPSGVPATSTRWSRSRTTSPPTWSPAILPGSRATAGRTLWSPTSNGGPVRCSDRRSTLTVSRARRGSTRSISTSARPPTSTSTGAGCTTSRWRSDSGEYLAVPFERVEPELPQWTLTTDVRPDPENVELLPFVAGELSIVRSPETVTPAMASGGDGLGFFRAPRADTASLDRDEFVRSTAGTEPTRGADASADRGAVAADTDFVRPEPVDTVEHAWVGAGVPLDANKATLDAYHRRLEAGAVEQSRISVLVVCNDEQMREEGEVADLYGLRDMVQFDIEVRHDLTREEMRETLQSDVDFLHYIGHVDDRGMQCTDDYLDLTAEDLDVGVSAAFLLNACQSYQQGEALVHRGSRGGIVTLSDVANSPATQLGRIIARLMNSGFNLRAALYVAKRELITGHQYIVVGDGGTTICHSRSGIALVLNLGINESNSWDLVAEGYPNGPYGVGTMSNLNLEKDECEHVIPSQIHISDIKMEEIDYFLDLEKILRSSLMTT